MPPKKITWGDIPNSDFVKDKDNVNGRWIECRLCNVRIKVRATFGFTEWEHHCASTKHCDKLKHHLKTGSMNKLTSYFHTSSDHQKKIQVSPLNHHLFRHLLKKRPRSQFLVLGLAMVKIQNYFIYILSTKKRIV